MVGILFIRLMKKYEKNKSKLINATNSLLANHDVILIND